MFILAPASLSSRHFLGICTEHQKRASLLLFCLGETNGTRLHGGCHEVRQQSSDVQIEDFELHGLCVSTLRIAC
ncbi:hypothetical protein BS17DRAFT_358921 [Gyrodon lividus]|nr:hypothetical protein BS17DRAFT_358921 [Gyrodon lividus]